MTRAIPDVLLERYRLNELPGAAHADIARAAAADASVLARLDALDRSDAEIRARYAPGVLAPHADSHGSCRAGARSRGTRRALVLAGALAAAVLALVVAIPRLAMAPGDTRIKGAAARPALAVYRRTPAGSERLADGDVARAGDLLRIGYAAAGKSYGVILSIDGAGGVTLHLPREGDEAPALAPGGLNLLDSSYELDEAPRIERFYFVTGTEPFHVGPIVLAARRAGPAPPLLPLPSGLEQVTFAVHKEVRR
jgi:hypothetical protein